MPHPNRAPAGVHYLASRERCWLILVRAVCACGWRSWPRWTDSAAGTVLLRHMSLAGRADVRAAGDLWTPGS